jgi:hypothetical protein
MPTITEATIRAFAHCPDVTCPGSAQEPVDGVRREVAETIGERGGDGPFVGVVEKSTLYTHFADPADAACSECGKTREISDMERPNYGTAFGGSDALLRLRQIGAHGASRDSLMAAAQDAKARPATAREQLDEAYVLGRIDEPEYQRKRAVLEGVVDPVNEALKAAQRLPDPVGPSRGRAKKTVED